MTKIEKINQIIERVEGDSFSEKLQKAREIVEDEEKRKPKFIQEAEELFGKMRGLTEEEAKATHKVIEDISKPLDKNIKEFF